MKLVYTVYSVLFVLATNNHVYASCSTTPPASLPSPTTTPASPGNPVTNDITDVVLPAQTTAAPASPGNPVANAIPNAQASATPAAVADANASTGSFKVTKEMMDKANPSAAGNTCVDEEVAPGECATNERAVASINVAIEKYGFKSRGQVVGVVANLLFESGKWKYNRKHFPSIVPGQGTRSMISESFVSQYVSFLFPEKAAELTAAPKGPDGQASNETKEARLALVYGDEESFGSGFWFLRHAIPDYFDKGIPKDDDPESFKEFVTKGIVVGEEDVPKRLALWDTVNKAFKA